MVEETIVKSNYAIKMDKTLDQVCTVESGDTFKLETVNAYGEHFSNMSELMDLIAGKYGDKHHHPLTGPINVKGAQPGDVLKVTIHSIDIDIAAQALSKSAGISPIEVKRFGDRAPILGKVSPDRDSIKMLNGMYIDYRPMLGIIGTAPSEQFIKTGHAGKTGGNLDIPFIGENCSVYLPVETEEAKLFIGDAHAAQGYGELGGIAFEASAVVTLTVEVLEPRIYWDNIMVLGREPFSKKYAVGVVGVGHNFESLNEAVEDSYYGAANILAELFPTIQRGYICNLITAVGHSMNGQAFSKTSESTCIINILEADIRRLKRDSRFNIFRDIEPVLFKQKEWEY